MKARITVTLKNGVLDPQGKAIAGALTSLEFNNIKSVRQGKVFDVDIDVANKEEAQKQLQDMCERLLANTVIENYQIELG